MSKGLAIAGSLAAVGALALVAEEYASLGTGDENLDRFGIRANVLVAAALTSTPAKVLMAIVARESGGEPINYLGDVGASGGPSIGPMQVYRQTAKDLGLWAPPAGTSVTDERALYADLADHESMLIFWGAKVFKQKLEDGGGNVEDAIRRYNGSGSAAASYRDGVIAYVNETYGNGAA